MISGGIILGFLLIPILYFVIGLLLCIWVYRDAEKRGMSGALWLIIVLIANILGLLIYLIVREPEGTRRIRPASPNTLFCRYCGSTIPQDSKFCLKCGREQT